MTESAETLLIRRPSLWASSAQRVILLFFAALNILLAFFAIPEGSYQAAADVAVSMEPARALLAGQGLVHPNGELYTWGTPLYPLFLAFFVGLFPWKIALSAIVSVQCLLLYATGLLTRRLTALFAPGAATLAQIFLLFNPNMVISAHLLQTEILFTFLLTAGIVLLLDFPGDFSWRRAAASGFCVGLATLVRPAGQFVILLLPLLFVLLGVWKKRGFFVRSLGAGGLAFIMAILVVSPWVARNQVRFGTPFLTTNAGLYLEAQYRQLLHNGYNMADAETGAAGEARVSQRLAEVGLDSGAMQRAPMIVRSRILSGIYLDAILDVPVAIHAKAMVESVAQLYIAGGASNICNYLGIAGKQAIVQFQGENRAGLMEAVQRFLSRIDFGYAALLALTFGYTIIMRLVGLAGLVRMVRTALPQTLALVAVLAVLTLSYLYLGQSRFRVPLEPILAVMAAVGFARWFSPSPSKHGGAA